MHIETNIDRHGETPNLGMQSWIEENEIERHGEYMYKVFRPGPFIEP